MATPKMVLLSISSRRISKRWICGNVSPVSPVRLRSRCAQATPDTLSALDGATAWLAKP